MTYQANRLLTLLNNYPEALKNTELAYNSAGNATEKFAIYQESAEAKVAKFKATLENLFIDTLNSSVIKTVIDFGTSIVELTNHIGILNIAVATLATKFASMALASTLGIQSLKGVALAVAGVNIPITILIASLGALVIGINAYQLAQEKANQETLKASDAYIDSKRKSDELVKSYEELARKTSLTQVEFDKLQRTKQDLLKMYPSLFDNLGKEADNYVNVTNKVRELDTAQRNQVLNQLQGMKAIADAKIAEYKASKKMVEEKGLTEVGKREASQFTAYDVEVAKLEKQQHEAYTKIQDIYKSSLDVVDFTPEKASSGNVSGIKTPSKEKSKTNKSDILDNFRQQISLIKELTSATAIYQSKADILEGDAKIKALDKVTNGYKLQQKAVSAYSTSIRQYISTHKLSADDMEKLQDILRSNGEEWWNLEKSIKSVKDTQKDYNDKILKDTIDKLEKQRELLEKDIKKAFDSYTDSLEKQAKVEEAYYDNLISAKEREIDLLEEKDRLLEQQQKREQILFDIAKLRQQLLNVQNEKNIRTYIEGKGFVFTADEDKIQEINESIADKNKELYELDLEEKKNLEKKKLQTELDAIKQSKKATEDKYDRLREEARYAYESATNITETELGKQNSAWALFVNNNESLLNKMKGNILGVISSIQSLNSQQLGMVGDIVGTPSFPTSGGVSDADKLKFDYVTNQSGGAGTTKAMLPSGQIMWVDLIDGKAYLNAQKLTDYEKFEGTVVKTGGGYYKIQGGQGIKQPSGEYTFHNGIENGLVGGLPIPKNWEQLALLAKGEGVFNNSQMNNIADFVNNAMPKASNGGGDINIANITLPNVQNATQFARELQKIRMVSH